MIDKVAQGKRNRRMGLDFERRTRKDLEEKGWIVSKWQNNVGFEDVNPGIIKGKCIPAKMGRFRSNQGGFPDFIAFMNKCTVELAGSNIDLESEIMAVECKTNRYLDPTERKKCDWLLKNNIFSKILIAYKEKEGRKIVVKYKEYETSS